MPKISVIIPALNEEKYIKHVFAGLKTQTFKDFEIIVADGGSTDATIKISKKYAKVVPCKKKGIAAGRNAGAAHAKGEILVFIDGDTKPTPGLLEAWSKTFEDENTIAATGPIYPLEKTDKLMTMGYEFVSVFFVKTSIAFGAPNVVGSNFAIRRNIFKKVRGFNGDLVTYEDWDLSMRIRKYGKIRFVDNAIVYSSTRRVKKWGIFGYFIYHVENSFRYYLFKRPRTDYDPIR